MADLTGSTIASTYKDLLQVSNSNSGIDSTLRVIEDGEGTESILSISSSAAKISSSSQLQFRDSAIHISSDADGYLNVQADTGVNINIGGTDELAVTSTTSTFGTNLVIPDSGTIGNASDTDLLTFTSGVLTVAGELDATTLDISGNADIDGTLEADAITVDGVALATFIRDTVGTNMLSSNTESGITVTYDTSNDNIDFSINASQTGITSLLATDIVIGEDAETKIDFETANEIHFDANNAEKLVIDGTATTTFQPIHFSGSDAVVQIKFTDSSQPADVFTMTSAEYSGGGGNKNKFSALNSTTLSFETGGAERLLIDQDDSVTLGQGMNFGALHTNVSVGTSATEVFDVSDVAPANSTGDGIYLFNIVRRGGSYSTRFVGIFGVDNSGIALVNTIENNDFTITVSGMSLRAASSGTYNCSATFQPLAIGD